ncbi:recombination protein NinG [Delftia acidovorans]|uniref:recombination protein NinG n=1 Tax=Delftia acidovorans TaxID=80866 RepID=UPI000F817D16|nr:recombination protein NinG [Delftia acidovorans]
MLKSTKPNRCKHCKKRMPEDKAHHVLHDGCKDAWIAAHRKKQDQKKAREVRAKAKIERAETRRRREALKTVPQLLREAQQAFNAFIRARDQAAGHACISSGRPLDWSGNAVDAGHYRSTGAASHLRFNEDNCHAQSKHDNQYLAGNAIDYRIRLVERIGLERVEALEADNQVRKWTRTELIEIRDTYRAKAKALKKASNP